jgi:hypothetical protein
MLRKISPAAVATLSMGPTACHVRGKSRERRTLKRIARFVPMSIDPLTGVIAVSLVVALLCFLWPPPPDDYNGPGETAP